MLRAGGASLDALAQKFDVERDAVWRHWTKHVSDEAKATYLVGPAEMATLAEKAAAEGDSVIDYLRMCRTTLTSQLAVLSEAGDSRGVGYITGQLVKVLEAIGKVTGELGALAQSTINITNNVAILEHPAFAKVQATLLRALAEHPAARSAVVAALRGLDLQDAPAVSEAKVIVDHAA